MLEHGQPRRHRRLQRPPAALAGGDRQVDARHHLVARENALDEHPPILLEVAEAGDGRRDEDARIEPTKSHDHGSTSSGLLEVIATMIGREPVRKRSTRSGTGIASRA